MPAAKEQNTKAFLGSFTQDEVNYVPLSSQIGTKACANCRFFMNNGCYIVQGYDPEPIIATGICDRWEVGKVPAPPDVTPLPVMIVEPPMTMDDSAEMSLPVTRRGLRELIADTVKRIRETPFTIERKEQSFSVWKSQDEYYWLARHTGKFIDREGEIITNKASDEYVSRVQKGLVPMPELWTWHKKGTMHGQADFVWKAGGFVLALGRFIGTPEQKKQAATYYQNQGDKIKLSHMFKYPTRAKQGKVYHAYNTVEITTLPDGAEAFPYTSFQEFDMPFTKEQEEMIRGIGGDDMLKRAQSADTKALTDTIKLETAGVVSKGLDNFEGSTIPETDEVKALGVATKDLDARLKALESIKTTITALETSFKAIDTRLEALQNVQSTALAKANDVEKKLLEYQAVQPPASKSNDTLLNEREKSLLDSFAESVKQDGAISLIEKAMGKAPAASGN